MIDLHPQIAAIITPHCPCELEFPTAKTVLPVATITQLNNSAAIIIDNAEVCSNQQWQIDVWCTPGTTGRQQAAELAGKIDKSMMQNGFSRQMGRPMQDPSGLARYTLRYIGLFDARDNRIYQI